MKRSEEGMNNLGEDFVIEWMKENDVPLTRKNYLTIAYLGDDPQLDAEALAAIPEELTDNVMIRTNRPRRKK
jgi:hypothetical protein